MPSEAASSTTLRYRSNSITPWRRCISSRGQKTHLALQRFVLSIWTMSGHRGARSRPVRNSTLRTGFALASRRRSAPWRARRVTDTALRLSLMADGERGPLILDDLFEIVAQAERRRVADEVADLREIRHPPRHVLETRLVGLIVGQQLDLGPAAGGGPDTPGEIEDRDLLGIPDVEDLADGARLLDEAQNASHHIADV